MKQEERHTHLELCIPYVFGRLNPGNRKQFEDHLAGGCEQCNKELAQLYEAMSLLPLALEQQQPPAHVKGKLLSRVRTARRAEEQVSARREKATPEVTTPQQRPWFGYALAAVLAVIIVALGVYVNDLINTVSTQEQTIVELKTDLERQGEIMKVLQSQRIEIVFMSGQQPSPAGYGKIIWDPAKKTAIFQVANLPTVPSDKDYQLWIIKNKKPIPAGVFAVTSEKEKESYFKVMNLDVAEKQEIDAFAITLEPKGGSPEPTLPIYMMGTTAVN